MGSDHEDIRICAGALSNEGPLYRAGHRPTRASASQSCANTARHIAAVSIAAELGA